MWKLKPFFPRGLHADAEAVTPSQAARVRREQIRLLYRTYLSGSIPAAIGALLFAIMMWQQVSHWKLLIWLGATYLISALRFVLFLRYPKDAEAIEVHDRWARYHVVGSVIAAGIWGSAGVIMFVPGSMPHQMVLLTGLFGICAGATSVLGFYLPSYLAYAFPLVLPFTVRTLIEGDPIHLAIAAICGIFLVSFIGYGVRQNRLIAEALHISLANLDLIEQLKEQKNTAERAKEDAVTANRAKSQFLAAASHDLRQPLQALRLFTEALNEKIYYPEVRSIVNNINTSVEALEMLFNELLDVSKLDAGVIVPKLSNFSLNHLFDQIRTDFTPQAAEKRVRLRVVPTEAAVYSDPTLLVRVLRNLVANAIRYTPEKGAILLACRRRRDGRVKIEVRDSGVGIAPEQHRRIFDEFYQVGNPERDRRKGLGLGLAIVKRIEELIDCKVALRSSPGRGSAFSVVVPRGQLSLAPLAAHSDGPKLRGNLSGTSIVVIDDEQGVREGMRVLLEEWGAEVTVAADAEEAMSKLGPAQRPVHLVIADYRLQHDLTGIDAITKIRRNRGTAVPALLLSGDMTADLLREAQASGYQLLSKPVAPARLRASINALVKAPARELPDAATS